MPDRGQRSLEGFSAPVLSSAEPLELRDARWLQVTFEVRQDAVLETIPCDITRPVPCYARLFVLEAKAGPRGPLGIAALLVGGRFQMQPHNVVATGAVEGVSARDAETLFGAGFVGGSVTIVRDGPSVHATVGIGDSVSIEAHLPTLRAADEGMLRWDPWLTIGTNGSGAGLYQFALAPHPERSFLSKGATIEIRGSLPSDSPWVRLRNLLTISSCYVEGALTFGERSPANQAG